MQKVSSNLKGFKMFYKQNGICYFDPIFIDGDYALDNQYNEYPLEYSSNGLYVMFEGLSWLIV